MSLIRGIGDRSLMNLVSSKLSIKDIRALDPDVLGRYVKGKNKKEAIDFLLNNFDEILIEAQSKISQLEQDGVGLITFWDEKYPRLYRSIHNPPIFLYVKGNKSLLNQTKSIAIVGTRDCSDQGTKIARRTAKYFAAQGYNIVSGLASGIDTAGHKGALEAKGSTTAVVVDVLNIYPKENVDLATQIVKNNGLLIAESAPGSFVHRGLFVARDRLQSALCLAVFPIETDIKGGTMHTVGFAQEQGRLLFCPDLSQIPKRAFMKTSGIKKLIDDGAATLYTMNNYDDVIKELEKKERELFSGSTSGVQQRLF